MKQCLKILVLILFAACSARAQNSWFSGVALGINPFTAPAPGGTPGPVYLSYAPVRVCNLPLTQTQPCLPLATITDLFGNPLSVGGPSNFGQLTTNVVGGYQFGCQPGQNIQIQVAPANSVTPSLSFPATCPSGNGPFAISLNGNNYFTGGFSATTLQMEADSKCTTVGVYDQTCFTNAIAVATPLQKVHVAAHTYNLTGSGSEIILQNLPLKFECDPAAVLQVASSVPNTTDIWHWTANAMTAGGWRMSHCNIQYTNGSSQNVTAASNATPIQITITAHGYVTGNVVTCRTIGGNTTANGTWVITRVDANNFTLNGSTGIAAYTSGGTCALVPGGYGLHVDSTNGSQISGFTIEENTIGQGGKPAMFFDNTGLTQDGIFTGQVRHNTVKGGFKSARMGDSIDFVDNTTTGGFDGFIVDQVQNASVGGGAHNTRFLGNNITNQGCAFRVTAGSFLQFSGNNAEPTAGLTQGGPDGTNCSNGANFDIDCTMALPCFGIHVFDNTVSASITTLAGPQNVFRCNWCDAVILGPNNPELSAGGQKQYILTANATLNRVWLPIDPSFTTPQSRITDSGTKNLIFWDSTTNGGTFGIGLSSSPSNNLTMYTGSGQNGDVFALLSNAGAGLLELSSVGNTIVGGGADNGNQFQITGNMSITGNPRSNTAGSSTLGIGAFPWNSLFLGTNSTSMQHTGTFTANRTMTWPDATGVPLISGNGDGTHSIKNQTLRVAGCATGAAQFATCDNTVTWTTPFADASYTATCTGDVVSSGQPIIQGQSISAAKTASAITVRTTALTAAAAQFSTIDCTAIHD